MTIASMINTGMNSPQTKAAMRGANPESFTPIINGYSLRPAVRTIYIYSVAKRAFPARHLLYPKLMLKGCENGERWVRCTTLPDPVPQPCPDQERGGTRIDDNNGWCVAIDMLNPGNVTMDPYLGSDNTTYCANSNGTNLICEGIWCSLNAEPTEEEIKRAERCRDRRYRYLTTEATRLSAVSTAKLNEFLQRWPDTHIAMAALGLTANWTQTNEVKRTCPNCGDLIKDGIAFHQSSAGVMCILDVEKAYRAGAINKERYEQFQALEDEADEPEKRRGGWPKGKPRKEPVPA